MKVACSVAYFSWSNFRIINFHWPHILSIRVVAARMEMESTSCMQILTDAISILLIQKGMNQLAPATMLK